MRQITELSVNAFNNGQKFNSGNMSVRPTENGAEMYLHGNLIAKRENGKLFITSAGWKTNTTKERLNALDGVSIKQVKGVWYLNGSQWDGSMTEVGKREVLLNHSMTGFIRKLTKKEERQQKRNLEAFAKGENYALAGMLKTRNL